MEPAGADAASAASASSAAGIVIAISCAVRYESAAARSEDVVSTSAAASAAVEPFLPFFAGASSPAARALRFASDFAGDGAGAGVGTIASPPLAGWSFASRRFFFSSFALSGSASAVSAFFASFFSSLRILATSASASAVIARCPGKVGSAIKKISRVIEKST